MKKNLLLVTFLTHSTLPGFLTYLKKKFNIESGNTHIFKSLDDERIFLTFKILLNENENFDIKNNFKNTLLIHKKGTTFYTINALNKLIEQDYGLEVGNINYRDYEIDWNKYIDKFITVKDNNLQITSVSRIYLK